MKPTEEQETSEEAGWAKRNTLSPMRFVVGFGVVSLFGDATYEGARAITGPFLGKLGASAALVGLVTGGGEAAGYVIRLLSGPAADTLRRRWLLAGWGYVVNVVLVPLLALAHSIGSAAALIVGERAAKGVRAPARDTMLAEAGTVVGQGKAFSVHEAMDQTGALVGPMSVALFLQLGAGFRTSFALLAIPAAGVIVTVSWLRRRVPHPEDYSGDSTKERDAAARLGFRSYFSGMPRRYWLYLSFTTLTMAGYATFGLLSVHLSKHRIVPTALIPVLYAATMGMAAIVALIGGRAYTRSGLRSLAVMPVLAAVVPFLSFSFSPYAAWGGALVWGAAMGLHESIMRAAVADIVPPESRGRGYGIFGAAYGLSSWLGGAVVGLLYGTYRHPSVHAVEMFVVIVEAVALIAMVPVFRGDRAQVGPPTEA